MIQDLFRVTGRVAVVTGAGRGLGVGPWGSARPPRWPWPRPVRTW
jgi:hypothetical protein